MKIVSEETKRKISEALKRYHSTKSPKEKVEKKKLKKKSKFEEAIDAEEARLMAPGFEKTKDGRHWRLKK